MQEKLMNFLDEKPWFERGIFNNGQLFSSWKGQNKQNILSIECLESVSVPFVKSNNMVSHIKRL